MTTDDGGAASDAGLADAVSELFGSRPGTTAASTGEPCAACGEPHAQHRLTLTVEWRDYLVRTHGLPRPDEACRAPLCSKCRSWAEMLEIAELERRRYGAGDRERIRAERDRFLEELRVDLVANLRVSAELSGFE